MSINEQFAKACDWLRLPFRDAGPSPVTSIDVVYFDRHGPMERPCLCTRVRRETYVSHNISDTDMDVANWRRYGNFVKTNKTVRELRLCIAPRMAIGGEIQLNEVSTIENIVWGGRDFRFNNFPFYEMIVGRVEIQLIDAPFHEIIPEAVNCLEAFFEGLKDNTSIESILFDADLGTMVPPLTLRHFFQNNQSLKMVKLVTSVRGSSLSPEQSRRLSTALRDIPLGKFGIGCRFINNGAVEQILLASRKVNVLWLDDGSRYHQFFYDNYVFTALAGMLRDPTTTWQELHVSTRSNRNLDAQRAENEIISSLTQNAELKILKVNGLFQRNAAVKSFARLLCNRTSIEGILQSNHTIEEIIVLATSPRGILQPNRVKARTLRRCLQYLKFNKILDKRKVAQIKIMQYYLSRKFEASPLLSMPLAVLPLVLGIDVPNMHKKCSAVFNILKGIPELCNVSSRNLDQSEEISGAAAYSKKKRQKTGI